MKWELSRSFSMPTSSTCQPGLRLLCLLGVWQNAQEGMLSRCCHFQCVAPGDGLCMKGEEGIHEGTEFFQRMMQNDCPVDVITLNIVIKGLVQAGLVHQEFILLRELHNYSSAGECQPDVVTLNTVILRLCLNGLAKVALELFQVMIDKKVMPNVFTYRILICGLSLEGNVDDALSLFKEMERMGIVAEVCHIYYLSEFFLKTRATG